MLDEKQKETILSWFVDRRKAEDLVDKVIQYSGEQDVEKPQEFLQNMLRTAIKYDSTQRLDAFSTIVEVYEEAKAEKKSRVNNAKGPKYRPTKELLSRIIGVCIDLKRHQRREL